jgi:hypothetical protein
MTEQESAHPSDETLRDLTRFSISNGASSSSSVHKVSGAAAAAALRGASAPGQSPDDELLDPEMDLSLRPGSVVQPPAPPVSSLSSRSLEGSSGSLAEKPKVAGKRSENLGLSVLVTIICRHGSDKI